MDISKVVNYEATHCLDLVAPGSEEPVGIVFEMRSAESDEAKKVQRKHIDAIYERRQRGKLIKGSSEVEREIERVASCIASWDWGDHDWKGAKPELSMKTAVEVLTEAGWIYGQAKEACDTVANFSTVSATD
jgi:hypothetical protein